MGNNKAVVMGCRYDNGFMSIRSSFIVWECLLLLLLDVPVYHNTLLIPHWLIGNGRGDTSYLYVMVGDGVDGDG